MILLEVGKNRPRFPPICRSLFLVKNLGCVEREEWPLGRNLTKPLFLDKASSSDIRAPEASETRNRVFLSNCWKEHDELSVWEASSRTLLIDQ